MLRQAPPSPMSHIWFKLFTINWCGDVVWVQRLLPIFIISTTYWEVPQKHVNKISIKHCITKDSMPYVLPLNSNVIVLHFVWLRFSILVILLSSSFQIILNPLSYYMFIHSQWSHGYIELSISLLEPIEIGYIELSISLLEPIEIAKFFHHSFHEEVRQGAHSQT
jgi:hypothetical protein